MPIVYIHGVANREESKSYQEAWKNTRTYIRRYLAPTISDTPDDIVIENLYWGDLGAKFYWDRESRPPSPLLGMGAAGSMPASDQALAYAAHPDYLDYPVQGNSSVKPTGPLIGGGPIESEITSIKNDLRLQDFKLDDGRLLITALTEKEASLQPAKEAIITIAMDEVLNSQQTWEQLRVCKDLDEELQLLERLFLAQLRKEEIAMGALVAQGAGAFFKKIADRTKETLNRVNQTPGYLLSRTLAEIRKPLNDIATLFFGDVVVYLEKRGNASDPGPIPLKAMAFLSEIQKKRSHAQEPLIVISHSMGGQIIYDLLTHFIPGSTKYQEVRIDYWCAAASQVGLFEELKLFRESTESYAKESGTKVPYPSHQYLGDWWNVWDHNDFISFSAGKIFEGVRDEEFNSGMSILDAHGGYLKRPSFYRKFAQLLLDSKLKNWNRI